MLSGENPAVSVVMPAYNARLSIGKAIESVRAQTLTDWELIVVDDASTDGTAELVREFAAGDERICHVVNAKNEGVALARNRALELARGRYVAFLDSDDLWMPGKLQAQVAFLDSSGGWVSYGSYRRVDEQGREIGFVQARDHVDYPAMLQSNFIGNLTGIYRREALPSLRFKVLGHEDYVFWLEAVRQAGTAVATPFDGPLAVYRVAAGSVSANKLRAIKWQWSVYRRQLGLPWPRSVWLFVHYIFFALAKRRR
ncbi:glycosyl transferase family protein [Bordetella ansorpii]|uniref:Glycosyl transferase family protein n=1 Tax=Bordetella ansorpii TaxID=288768 RepID=A0A157S9P8_9BORD|nr:glycosyltransferase family 2 protein [Bordetella ansorpii]SAI67109.1 glycosyl transferase family protein [Bordetella ansorpii]